MREGLSLPGAESLFNRLSACVSSVTVISLLHSSLSSSVRVGYILSDKKCVFIFLLIFAGSVCL